MGGQGSRAVSRVIIWVFTTHSSVINLVFTTHLVHWLSQVFNTQERKKERNYTITNSTTSIHHTTQNTHSQSIFQWPLQECLRAGWFPEKFRPTVLLRNTRIRSQLLRMVSSVAVHPNERTNKQALSITGGLSANEALQGYRIAAHHLYVLLNSLEV